jgi:hypothetical protein
MEILKTIQTTGSSYYWDLDARFGSDRNRKCIDGKITGCGKCVGYCQFTGHPGFLTAELKAQHECTSKGCFYYIEKPSRVRDRRRTVPLQVDILSEAKKHISHMEGVKCLTVVNDCIDQWCLNYITITNDYSLIPTKDALENKFGCKIRLNRLPYAFDVCVQLILAD